MPDVTFLRVHRVSVWLGGCIGVFIVGILDYLSGTELRVYPLYFGPIGLAAWRGRRIESALVAALSATTWLVANLLAGMRFSTDSLWIANTLVHGCSFLFVGLLISALQAASRAATELSRTDSLTQLRNSRAFYEDARPLLALCRRRGRPVTLAYIDLDHFKSVNDTQGHEVGDVLLRDVAQAIQRSVRPSDLPARLGGDEFAVFLPELGPRDAAAALERLRAAVVAVVRGPTPITASVGGVTYLEAPLGLEELIRRADALMYDAKSHGRNRLTHNVIPSLASNDARLSPPARRDETG